jgi:hypothetical protein
MRCSHGEIARPDAITTAPPPLRPCQDLPAGHAAYSCHAGDFIRILLSRKGKNER